MKECGFDRTIQGENVALNPSKLQIEVGSAELVNWDQVLPPPQLSLLYPWWWFKKWLARLIVLPYMNEVTKACLPLKYANRSFETYVIGYK
jgi:hypothetical protein